jgi:prepilin-type processing-associated H-X9-DG protein
MQKPDARHNDGVLIVWVDGHVKWLRMGQFYWNQTPPDRFFDLQ